MFTSNGHSSPSKLTWALAAAIIAAQLLFSAGLLWVNQLAEDIPGRRVDVVMAAPSPTRGYVDLPDSAFSRTSIPREECCARTAILYRTHLTAEEAALPNPAVLIVSAHDNALLYVDGRLAAGLGSAEGDPPSTGRRPHLLRIPDALAQPGARIDIVVKRAVGFGHLRPFYIGAYDDLYQSYLLLRVLRSDLPFANAIVGVFVAAFCFCAAPLFGARALLFSLSALAAAWAAQHVGALLIQPPWGANINNVIYLSAFHATLVSIVWFFVEWTSVFARPKPPRHPFLGLILDPWGRTARRRLSIASIALILVGSAIIAWRLSFDSMVGAQDVNRVLSTLGLLVMAFCLVRVISFYMRSGFRDPIEASAFLFVILAAIADMAMVRFFNIYGVFLSAAVAFFPLALLVSLAARARGVFEAATATTEKLNLLVAEREREILKNMDDIRRNERAAMLLEERSRIMRDMHDGIGGQLLGLILQARSQKLTDTALVTGLEQSLDDLRLVVDSLEQGEGSLTGALGAFRARIEPRCEAAGVDLVWDIHDVGETPHIGPDKTLQIYRILLEACTNALRHGSPSRIRVSMHRVNGAIRIALADDGAGFGPTATPGRGLSNMKVRAQRIGALLDTRTGADGVEVAIELSA